MFLWAAVLPFRQASPRLPTREKGVTSIYCGAEGGRGGWREGRAAIPDQSLPSLNFLCLGKWRRLMEDTKRNTKSYKLRSWDSPDGAAVLSGGVRSNAQGPMRFASPSGRCTTRSEASTPFKRAFLAWGASLTFTLALKNLRTGWGGLLLPLGNDSLPHPLTPHPQSLGFQTG